MAALSPRTRHRVWAALVLLSTIVVATTVAVCLAIWVINGQRRQSRLEGERQSHRLAQIDTVIADLSARADAQQNRINVLAKQQTGLTGRFDQLPKTSEYAHWTSRLSSVDVALEAERRKLNELNGKVQSLATDTATSQSTVAE